MPLSKNKRYKTLFGESLYADILFCDLSPKTIKFLSLKKKVIRFDKGVSVCQTNAFPKGVYILLQGQSKLSFIDLSGKTHFIRLVKPNELVGLIELLADVENETILETITPCLFEFISRKDFLKFLHNESETCFRLLKPLSFNLQKSYQMIRSLG